jgi:multidrug resistance efflux pump
MDENNQQLHSEETQEIITKPPSWIIKWGISLFIITLLILGALSFMIHYPDLIKTRMVIYSAGSSKPITSNINGRLIRLLVKNNQAVTKDEPLAFIEAPQSHDDVLQLSAELKKLKMGMTSSLAGPTKSQLEQMKLIENQLRIIFRQGAPLNDDSSVSKCDNCRAAFINRLNTIINYVDKWKSQFVISAAQAGNVSVIGLISEGQPVKAGQPLFYVNNNQSGFYGEMSIPQYEISKVKKGQKVLIKLSSYRFEDFGLITGTIDTIGSLPYNDSVYVSKVIFNNPANKNIILKSGLSAESDIVTKDVSLVNRLIKTLKKAITTQ